VSLATTLCAFEYLLDVPCKEDVSGLNPSFLAIKMFDFSSFSPEVGNLGLYLSGYWISRRVYV
jgi:hypothetical protein